MHRERRIIKTEEKAKVVAAIWGTKLIQFLAALAILHQDDMKKGMNLCYSQYRPSAVHSILHIVLVDFLLFFISSWCKIASVARNWISSAPPSCQAFALTFAFSSVFILLLCYALMHEYYSRASYDTRRGYKAGAVYTWQQHGRTFSIRKNIMTRMYIE